MTSRLLLAIDIGNTNIGIGFFRGKQLVKRYSIATAKKNLHLLLKNIVSQYRIKDAIISSVVPAVTRKIRLDLKRLLGKPPFIIGTNITVPISNRYRKPKQVGSDRLVSAYAGVSFYGAPLIIVDFGTAVTFDVVSAKGEYLGGMILPGLEISLVSLHSATALLPKLKLSQPKEFIGRNTKNSILSGIVYGFAALTDNLVRKIKTQVGRNSTVIGTGGNINLISRFAQELDKIDETLVLKGLSLIYQVQKKVS